MPNEDRNPPGTPVLGPVIVDPPPPGEPPAADGAELKADLAAARASLAEARAALEHAQRRAAIDRELARAQAIDPEVAAMLCEAAAGAAPAGRAPDAAALVADLRRRKPYLFRAPAPAPRASTSAAPHAPDADLDRLAEHARATGDRRALLHYLRLRRGN